MKIEILEEIRKDYKKEKQKLADEITKAIEYNKKLNEQKINMVELNNKMYEQNKKIKQLNEVIKREKNKKTETQNDTKEQFLSKLSQVVKYAIEETTGNFGYSLRFYEPIAKKIVKFLEMNNDKKTN